jgi:UDP-N-acetylmuramoyl-L-alanyl-D-glutamate--2,6-diaminopimelate ligase
LLSAKKLTQAQLLLVFGCGGDRDKRKRPEMGAVAVKFADECWLTSDNPRSEKQVDIAVDILAGVGALKDKIHVCEDRAVAIEQAISSLQQGGILVIAGKGHETYMDIQGNKMPWSDKATALAAIRKCEVQACI